MDKQAGLTWKTWNNPILLRLQNTLLQIVLLRNLHSNGRCHERYANVTELFLNSKVSTGVRHTSFGIKLPKDVKEDLEIDRITRTDFWQKAINKEMSKVKFAWKADEKFTPKKIRSQKTNEYIGFQEIGCPLIIDVKMDFTRKAMFVAGGHTTEAPSAITYLSVVLRDSVRLAFIIAALNGLDIMSWYLENAYLNATSREKIWFEGGI